MKLYVNSGNGKIYLNIVAPTRYELASAIGSPWFNLNGRVFHVNHVIAETTTNNTGTGAVVGGLVGLLGGPLGVLIGGVLGGAIGNNDDTSDKNRVNRFNQSYYHG